MSGNVPPSSRAGKYRKVRNELERAVDLHERFSGNEAEIVGKYQLPKTPKVGVVIGTLDGVLYTTNRDGETEKYIHKFRVRDKPLLVSSEDGTQLFIVGGSYRMTELGIVDGSDRKHRNAR